MNKRRRRRKLRTWMALVMAAAVGIGVFAAGMLYVTSAKKNFVVHVSEPAVTPEDQFMERLAAGNYEGIYEATSEMMPLADSRESYEGVLKQIIEPHRDDLILHTADSDKDGYELFCLYAYDLYLADVYKKSGSENYAIPIYGTRSFTVEVPAGAEVTMNGTPLPKEKLLEHDVEASDFFAVSGDDFVPHVDIYQIDGLIGEPVLDVNGKQMTVLKDVMSGHMLAGTKVDESMHRMILDAAECLARYPAQDGSLGEVTAVSYTGSSWYQRYIGLQPYWFSPHDIMEISNEQVLKAVMQSEDTMTAHVVFDYYCDDGELHRTWNIGYQLTFVNVDGEWLICNTEICNELNPNETLPE